MISLKISKVRTEDRNVNVEPLPRAVLRSMDRIQLTYAYNSTTKDTISRLKISKVWTAERVKRERGRPPVSSCVAEYEPNTVVG